MDDKVKLITEYYRGLPTDRAKVETYAHGFEYLDELLRDGMTLEYGEVSLEGLLHKFKLSHIPARRLDELLLSHVNRECNICLYFDEAANNLFCVNLDNNHKKNNTALIPEMEMVVRLLRQILIEHGCEPLVIASGRGYHLWCRLDGPVENEKLYQFMLQAMAKALYGLHKNGMDHNKIKANFYPDPRTNNTVSLRLFGSNHMKNKVFSRVHTGEELLDEESSWEAFAAHMMSKTINVDDFLVSLKNITTTNESNS